jgi:zinc-binding alcohol dehydrogenase/oxidoreductase
LHKVLKSIVLNKNTKSKLELRDFDLPALTANQVKVAVKCAALNHRDEWCRQGLYPGLKDGVVLGSDGAGIVAEVGDERLQHWLGKEVIINPALSWGKHQKVQSQDFQILGMPSHGTLAEYVHVEADRLYEKPEHLGWDEAAALPLAGLTAFRALMVQGELQKGENVLITGFGGGVAQFAAQFAKSLGANVYVSSSSLSKLDLAKKRGIAIEGYDYTKEKWTEKALQTSGGFDLIIDSAMGDTLDQLISVVKPGGRIVFYGATRGNPSGFNARKVFWNQIKLTGSTMGSDKNFEEMLAFVHSHQIIPLIDKVFKLEQAEEAFERMKNGEQMGKIVISISV